MMTLKLTTALALGLIVASCSNDPAEAPNNEVTATTPASEPAASADDDTLEPEASKVEEGEEHNEEAPHTH
jgi:hypothetical protein